MTTALDTNVLLDVIFAGSPHQQASAAAIENASDAGPLIICEPVFAETASALSLDELRDFLDSWAIELIPSGEQALYEAGRRWKQYARRRPPSMQCADCGQAVTPTCRKCGAQVRARQHIMPDFLVGAHALTHAERLLTRDRGFYRTYFPTLTLE